MTGEIVSLSELHFYVPLRRESEYRFQPAEYDYLVVADGTLGELDKCLNRRNNGSRFYNLFIYNRA